MHEIQNVRVSSHGAAVTRKVRKVRVTNDFLEVQHKNKKGQLNADPYSDSVPQCLCAEALSKIPRGTTGYSLEDV